jgi:hypothetical protein
MNQWRSQKGIVSIRKNLNRSESKAQNFLEEVAINRMLRTVLVMFYSQCVPLYKKV